MLVQLFSVYLCHGNHIVVSNESLESDANLLEFLDEKQNETTYTNHTWQLQLNGTQGHYIL